jgi:hypothetical protein
MDTNRDARPADQLAAGSVVFGLVSLFTCWWFPFGPVVGTVGCGMGLIGWYGGRDGAQALVGTLLAACGTGAGLLLAWDYWWRLIGV